ncbi:hypothetical protein HPB50_004311 [Hyalomma asiaticum]|uniref:Uncharacterized protein n=1 Tax=Hyalomma asiaticum TaxID=266040 RepID=A0ACB7RH81_HYAAI|nr:hypothetical protein HPB50_004311 [Hyalomma asiaticum]
MPLLSQSKRARRGDNSDDGMPSAGRRSHHAPTQLPPSVKRNEHNTMERKRRDDLRVAFQELRVRVPVLFDNKKAAKVTILNEAATYARKLTDEAFQQERAYKHEQHRHHALRRKLALLQQQLQQQHQQLSPLQRYQQLCPQQRYQLQSSQQRTRPFRR